MVDNHTVQTQNKFIPLFNKWAFYYDEKRVQSSSVLSSTPTYKCLGTFDTVQGFWGYWNNIHINKLPENSNLRLFKASIPPSVDTAGGKWVISCEKENISKTWLICVLAMIGEQFEGGDQLCGSVLSIGKKGNTISLWTKASDKEYQEMTEREICQFLNVTRENMRFQRHRDSQSKCGKNFSIKLSRSADLTASSLTPDNNTSENNTPDSNTPVPSSPIRTSSNFSSSIIENNDDPYNSPFIDLTTDHKLESPFENYAMRFTKHRPRTQSAEELLRSPPNRLRMTLSEQELTSVETHMDSEEKNVEDFGPRPIRLASSIDSATFHRRWRDAELASKSNNYHLPKLHRRRGIRKPIGKVVLSPRRIQTSTPTFVPPDESQTQVVDFSESKEVTDGATRWLFGIRSSYWLSLVVLFLLLLPSLYYCGLVFAKPEWSL